MHFDATVLVPELGSPTHTQATVDYCVVKSINTAIDLYFKIITGAKPVGMVYIRWQSNST